MKIWWKPGRNYQPPRTEGAVEKNEQLKFHEEHIAGRRRQMNNQNTLVSDCEMKVCIKRRKLSTLLGYDIKINIGEEDME